MRKYSVHKIFGPTIQGEGGMTGAVCHFIRLSGCNMWDGRAETRATSQCPFCDTDFLSHTLMTAEQIVEELKTLGLVYWVTISGGEPALQVDQPLVDALHDAGYMVAIETNGTKALKAKLDYVTVSPKLPPEQTVLTTCHSLKLVFPHPNPLITPEAFDYICADTRYLQPLDAEEPTATKTNIERVLKQLYKNPQWRMSLQTHKMLGVE